MKRKGVSTWNYRVVRRRHTDSCEWVYGIHEAYYDENQKVWAISQDPMFPLGTDEDDGDALRSLERDMDKMLLALKKPVLDYDSIPEPGSKAP